MGNAGPGFLPCGRTGGHGQNPRGRRQPPRDVKAWIQEGRLLWDAAASGGREESPRDGQGAVSVHQRGPGGGGLGWQCSCVCHAAQPHRAAPVLGRPLSYPPPEVITFLRPALPRGHHLPVSCPSRHRPCLRTTPSCLRQAERPGRDPHPSRVCPLPPPPKAVDGVLHVPRTGTSPPSHGPLWRSWGFVPSA